MTTKRLRKNRGYRRLAAALLSGAVAITSCLSGAGMAHAEGEGVSELQNPRVEMNICDTVYFGNYWQEDTNGDGVADQNDEKTPIRWRILSRNGDDAYVLADQVLDYQPYHETKESITWETSTLRKWLNEDFYNTAFTAEEQEAVLEQTLVNVDNEDYGTEGGSDTVDRVYLPSIADITNKECSFIEDDSFGDQARVGKATAYAEKKRNYYYMNSILPWWLRSPGYDSNDAAFVNYGGNVAGGGYDFNCSFNLGVRPALHLNLSSHLVQKGDRMEISLKSVVWDLVELGSYEGKAITWRVLQISENDLFLLSDRILTSRKYHESDEDITWMDSTLRAWLNGEFCKKTFTEVEQAGIRSWPYENSDNPVYGTEGGEDTIDNITLLSLEDIINPAYGFPSDYGCEYPARIAYSSVDEPSLEDDRDWDGRCWWLRSPGGDSNDGAFVYINGEVNVYGTGALNFDDGIRPALHFNLSSYPLSKVGTVTAEAKLEDMERPITTDQPDITDKPVMTNQPVTTQSPDTTGKPDTTNTPSATNLPENTETPSDTMPTVTPSGSVSTDLSGTDGIQSVSGSSQGSAKNQSTKLNIKNKKKYSLSKKLTIQDADGIRSVKLNGKAIKIKAGKKSFSFKLSRYKKFLKKKGKWNRLVITDQKGKKKTVKFKIK